MAEFKGTIEEFHRYIGPRLRNLVQTITKGYRMDVGQCEDENCNSKENLEAAHIHGKERQTLILKSLEGFNEEGLISIDLKVLEERFKEMHYPLNETFRILCKNCHNKYDKIENGSVASETFEVSEKEAEQDKEMEKVLLIQIRPENKKEFKEAILKSKKAEIKVFYQNGIETKSIWYATNFTETSNIFGNLRSRPDFRQGNWQKKGIERVIVTVID